MSLQFILVRHALAEDRKAYSKKGLPDSKRPLVPRGIKDMRKISRVLKNITGPVDFIVTSPYQRARQTAKIVSQRYPQAKFIVDPAFAADRSLTVADGALRKYKSSKIILIVGHEPNLSELLSLYLTTKSPASFHMTKGGFAIIQFENRVAPRRGQLKCFLSAKNALKIANKL